MYPTLNNFVESLGNISDSRKEILDEFISYIVAKNNEKANINLNFICTHNSRRSHMAQIWAQVASSYYNIERVNCYSGGTEATAMFISVKETLEDQGFEFNKLSDGSNPIYAIKYDDDHLPIIAFSKTYDNDFNPKSNFAAVMTCDHADKNCPLINGAEKRFAVRYQDPKEFDNTDLQKEKYKERSTQIAEEMFYVFKSVSLKSG